MPTVTEHLSDWDVEFERLDHAPVETAREEAQVLGVDPSDVAKSVALMTARGIAVAVVPASCRVDLDRVRRWLSDPTVELATEGDILAAFMEFDPGALPPLGSLLRVPTLIDLQVLAHETVVIASGTTTGSVRVHARDLVEEPFTEIASVCAD